MTRRFWPFFILGVALVWAGCSSQPTTPSTDQFVADVKANLSSMDYEAALKNLERLIKNAEGQPIAQQALILRTALLTSMAGATKTMAEAYREAAPA